MKNVAANSAIMRMGLNFWRRLCLLIGALATFSSAHNVLCAEPRVATDRQRHNANRLTYLDENNPYYPHRDFPKLVTPQWVGEEGVECVVVLAIDDMRDSAKYEEYLRPILNRLKQIDGRAPVSIMTCAAKPDDPQLQQWLAEGLSLEVHTVDHPCPLLQAGDFAKAKSTYDRCIDLLHEVPGNKPVAFRMPCCDSLNTVSPRFFAEIFNKTTSKGNFLSISSSVFNLYTANDPAIPRELIIDADGREKFRKYLPKGVKRPTHAEPFNTFVNWIEDYPYPYVINRLCWEFPCVVPSDWSAQHLQKPYSPDTLRDLKAALDITVIKQGVFNLVFHPHGWIKAEQVVELIDHAVAKHGKKVKFLNFREALERLNGNLLKGKSLRSNTGRDNGIRIADLNDDGFLDAVTSEDVAAKHAAMPLPQFPKGIAAHDSDGRDAGLRFVDIDEDGHDDIVFSNAERFGVYLFETMQTGWSRVVVEGARNTPPASGGHASPVSSRGDASSPRGATPPNPPLLRGGGEREHAEIRNPKSEIRNQFTLPPIARADGTDNGFFVHSRTLFWQNEDTAALPDLVDRRTFNDILAQADLPPKPRSPEASLKSIQVRPGFQVELMAAEPLTFDPVAFAFGPDGKLWVVEMGDYPSAGDAPAHSSLLQGGGEVRPKGRVRYLDDTDGDGRYDKSTLFLEVACPTNVLPWKKGVLVTAAPDIFYAEDTDGDGRADVRETLYTGFGEGNEQHRVNGLVRGLDNWLYIANGDSGGTVRFVGKKDERRTSNIEHRTSKAPDGGGQSAIRNPSSEMLPVDIRGRDLRIRPETGEIETVTGLSQFGRIRDDWGNWFGCNNSNPMLQFVLDDHYQRRNPNFAAPQQRYDVPEVPGNSPVFPISRLLARFNDLHTANRLTSACSVIVYRDDLFGPHFAGNMFVSEPVHNLVHREVMSRDGLRYRSRRAVDEPQSEFLASSDNWFRPTTIQTGPDGALWIADMYRHVIEHPKWIPDTFQKKLDLQAGFDKGRIYRVYPVGASPRPIPRLDRLDTAKLVSALDGQSGWQRDTAQQLLIERFGPAADTLPDDAEKARCAKLLAEQVRGSQNPLCRLHSLCTLDGLNLLTPAVLLAALGDNHAGVRRQAVRLGERFPDRDDGISLALAACTGDTDPAVRLQLAYTLGEFDEFETGSALGQLLVEYADERELFSAAMSSINARTFKRVMSMVLRQPPAKINGKLVEALLTQAVSFGDASTIASLLTALSLPREGVHLPWHFSAIAALLDTLDRRQQTLGNLARPEPRAIAAARDKIEHMLAVARSVAAEEQASLENRLAALRILGRGFDQQAEDRRRLSEFLTPQTPPQLQAAAIDALGKLTDPDVAGLLLTGWRGYGPARRAQVLDVLLSRVVWIETLLAALESHDIALAEIDAGRRERLLSHSAQAVRMRAATLLRSTTDASRDEVVERYRAALALDGDSARGAQVFAKGCAACHRIGDVGHEVGPDLNALTDKSPESLLIAILDPNRAVEAKFVNFTAVAKTGLTFNGILAAESGNSVTLRGAEAKEQVILRDDLDELASTARSAMPEGLEKDLAPQDVADVIAFLRSSTPGAGRRQFAGNKPAVVIAGTNGLLHLTARTCELYGSTIVYEAQNDNLGYWSSADDRAEWTIETPAAGRYRVAFDWSCHARNAGNPWRLETAAGTLTGTIASTGDWETYRSATVGEILLTRGRQRITLRVPSRPQGALMDLKSIALTPLP